MFPNEDTSPGMHLYKSTSPIAFITELRVAFVLIYNNLDFIEEVSLLCPLHVFEYHRISSEYFVCSFSFLIKERISIVIYS